MISILSNDGIQEILSGIQESGLRIEVCENKNKKLENIEAKKRKLYTFLLDKAEQVPEWDPQRLGFDAEQYECEEYSTTVNSLKQRFLVMDQLIKNVISFFIF